MKGKKRKVPDKYKDSQLEKAFFAYWCKHFSGHKPTREYKFHSTRQYRLDFAWPSKKIGVEIHGMGPGHYSLPGMTKDFDKLVDALLCNWRIVYLTSNHLRDDSIREMSGKIAKLLDIEVIEGPTSYVPLRKRPK